MAHIDYLHERNIGCYIQYTLNDYEGEGLEKAVPDLAFRIDTFKMLVDRLGVGRVIWRFDPLILTDRIGVDDLLDKVRNIGDQLRGYTEKLVFSFADIASYRKVKLNLERNGINYIEWDDDSMTEFASRLSVMNRERGWNYCLATCGEQIDIERFGIEHNRCVDDDLMIRFAYEDKELMDYLKVDIRRVQPTLRSMFDEYDDVSVVPADAIMLTPELYAVKHRNNRDRGQRQFCGCVVSKDIGQYNTCPHLCEYCYANTSKSLAVANWERHQLNPDGEKIMG